jgi:hypothetical protein
MKIGIRHQDTYSRGELLLRSFFGPIYIGIPHIFLLVFLLIGSMFVSLITFWAILITGKFPRGMFNYQLKLMRWRLRVGARLMNLSDGYPAFGMDAVDKNVVLDVAYPESSSRGLLLARAFFGVIYVIIPHMLCLLFLQIGAMFVQLIAWWAVLITGKYPKGMHDYMTNVMRWNIRVGLYMGNMTDTYPPFNGKETDPINWNSAVGVEEHLVG